MSGSSRNSRPPENWQPGQDYWIYLPANLSDYVPARRTQNPRGRTRDPWLSFEERFVGGPNHGLASLPPPATPHPSSGPLLLIEDSYPRAWPDSPPTFYQPESKLNPEEQKQAVSKLRRQLYSPHINNILRRLGSKSTSSNPGGSFQDDEGKRCSVCLEDFETKQFVTVTPCNHMFHEECIVPWVKSQGKCPVCRFMIAEKTPPQRSSNDATSRRGQVERNLIF